MTRHHSKSILGTTSILVTVMSAALAGCVGSVDTGSNQDAPTWEEFKANTYREPWEHGVFVLNGDEILVDEKKLEEYYNFLYGNDGALIVNTAAGQDTVWSNNQKQNLTYCISENFRQLTNADGTVTAKDVIIQAMDAATASWEAVADVQFQYIDAEDGNCNNANEAVLFDVGMVQNQPYLARAFFPGDNREFRSVLVDTSSFNDLGALTVQGVMAHELGHVLGFRHEHTRPEGAPECFEDDNWRPLTDYDQLSVMHYPQCGGVAGRDLTITPQDAEGANALYGGVGTTPPPVDPGDPRNGTTSFSGNLSSGSVYDSEAIPVLAGSELVVTMTGTGDADLFVNFNSAANRFNFACRPYLDGSNESCNMTVPAGANSAYVMVDGFTSASFEVNVTYTAP